MIKADELRIGNWIADRGGKQWQIDHWEYPNKVASIEPYLCELHGHYIYGHPLTEELEYLQPIPLTPEILEKCGLSIAHRYSDGLPMPYTYSMLKLSGIIFEFSSQGYLVKTRQNSKLTCIKYLHQLQNFYFALTGQELTYNP